MAERTRRLGFDIGHLLRSGTLALAALLLQASADPPAEEGEVCIGGPTWRPSLADGARIEPEPVPASYRALFESKAPCVRWALHEASLVDWHVQAGSERSVSVALAYLERDHVRGAPATDRFGLELARAWRSALPDLLRARKVAEPPGVNYSAKHRFMEKSPAIRRLKALLAVRDNYLFLAEQHLRAAEEFGSAPLSAKAAAYLRATLDGTDFLEPLESREPAAGLLHFDPDRFRTEDFGMRSAILRARLSRSPEDLAAAERIVQSLERPHYRRLGEAVFSGGDDFCDIADGWNDAEALRAACDDDHSFRNRLTNYWINRATLDLLAGDRETGSGELAFRLLNRERSGGQGRGYWRRTEDDLIRLRLASADDHRRRLDNPGATEHEIVQAWQGVLRDLREAELLAPAHSSPARFRRIATAWLETWGRGETLFRPAEDGFRPADIPEHWRYAAYLRHLLTGLEGIATGGEPQ